MKRALLVATATLAVLACLPANSGPDDPYYECTADCTTMFETCLDNANLNYQFCRELAGAEECQRIYLAMTGDCVSLYGECRIVCAEFANPEYQPPPNTGGATGYRWDSIELDRPSDDGELYNRGDCRP